MVESIPPEGADDPRIINIPVHGHLCIGRRTVNACLHELDRMGIVEEVAG